MRPTARHLAEATGRLGSAARDMGRPMPPSRSTEQNVSRERNVSGKQDVSGEQDVSGGESANAAQGPAPVRQDTARELDLAPHRGNGRHGATMFVRYVLFAVAATLA